MNAERQFQEMPSRVMQPKSRGKCLQLLDNRNTQLKFLKSFQQGRTTSLQNKAINVLQCFPVYRAMRDTTKDNIPRVNYNTNTPTTNVQKDMDIKVEPLWNIQDMTNGLSTYDSIVNLENVHLQGAIYKCDSFNNLNCIPDGGQSGKPVGHVSLAPVTNKLAEYLTAINGLTWIPTDRASGPINFNSGTKEKTMTYSGGTEVPDGETTAIPIPNRTYTWK